MNLKVPLESAELQFKQILEDYFISVFDEKSLSSHGIDHHRRVWLYAKELLMLLPSEETEINSELPAKLIIASYLHDIGMSVESGDRHGAHSRWMCIDFLIKNHLQVNDFDDVLEAITNHDKKEYKAKCEVSKLLTILSVADDIDAFGFTGIYRYSDIYLTRGAPITEIGKMIIVNAAKRFQHLTESFVFADNFIKKQKIKFKILSDFFGEYNKQVISYRFGPGKPAGYCGVMELFVQMTKDKTGLKEVFMQADKYPEDKVIQWFFEGLKSEINYR
jgi:HD superfamily phosphodiesterase